MVYRAAAGSGQDSRMATTSTLPQAKPSLGGTLDTWFLNKSLEVLVLADEVGSFHTGHEC